MNLNSESQCEICQKSSPKYKCPMCIIKYCSVICYKSHKEKGPCIKPAVQVEESKEIDNAEETELNWEYETEDTVKAEKLLLLGRDYDIRKSLENKHLRDMLLYLNSLKNPAVAMEKAMKEPIFVDFVTHCLNVVEQ